MLIEQSKDGQISFDIEGTGEDQVKVTLANFHGIEINDFACAVARTALWIAEKQADADTASIVHRVYQALPLTDYGNVRQGNALRMDWNEVVPAERCTFICGTALHRLQQVAPLWKPLFADGIHIDLVHRTFVWDSQADDVAHVHVIIVGFSRGNVSPKLLFDGDSRREVDNINGYLASAPDAFVERRVTAMRCSAHGSRLPTH